MTRHSETADSQDGTGAAAASKPLTGPSAPVDGPVGDIVGHTEQRMARMVAYVRCATCLFVYVPLFGWHRLAHPLVEVLAAVAATAESVWFFRRARRLGTLRDRNLVWGDMLFCVCLMLIGSRAAFPHQRNVLTTELVPFSLGSASVVGFGLELAPTAIAAVVALAVAWTISVIPNVTLKLGSDLLGFGSWYVVSTLAAREMRSLSRRTAEAQAEAAESQRVSAERESEARVARQREVTHREIHDHLLPIVDAVAAEAPIGEHVARLARREAARARRLIMDPRAAVTPGFEAMITDLLDTYVDAGLKLVPVFSIVVDPPPDVAEVVAGATREALRNALKYAGPDGDVNLFVDATAAGVEVVVRDHGVGFDPDTIRPGGGFSGNYASVRRHGGACTVMSHPGQGTKVTIRWPAPADDGVEAQ